MTESDLRTTEYLYDRVNTQTLSDADREALRYLIKNHLGVYDISYLNLIFPWSDTNAEELGDSARERMLNALTLIGSGIINEVRCGVR